MVPGLRLRVGKHKRTWFYFAEYQVKGKRGTVFKRLGFWPRMQVADARRAALQEAAKVAAGRPQPGKRDAITLEAATADYLASLEARGKKSARFVGSLMRIHLLPDFGRFTLAELCDAPALMRDHHLKISKHKPVAANRVMSILSAIYRHASRLDRSLPPASPISAVRFNREEPKQSAMPFDKFEEWRERVEALPTIRQALSPASVAHRNARRIGAAVKVDRCQREGADVHAAGPAGAQSPEGHFPADDKRNRCRLEARAAGT